MAGFDLKLGAAEEHSIANTLHLSLTNEQSAFVDQNRSDGTLYATPSGFIRDLLRQRKLQMAVAAARVAVLASY